MTTTRRTLAAQLDEIEERFARLADEALAELERQGHARGAARLERRAFLKYEGTDVALELPWEREANRPAAGLRARCTASATASSWRASGSSSRRCRSRRWGAGRRRAASRPPPPRPPPARPPSPRGRPSASSPGGAWRETPLYERDDLRPGDVLTGPAIVVEATGTDVVEPGWRAELIADGSLLLSRSEPRRRARERDTPAIPSSSRSSTTASCRSPSRWGRRWPTRPRR